MAECSPVGWDSKIHSTASLQRSKTPPMSVLDITLNDLIVGLQ